MNETISAITASLEDAERMSGSPIHHAVIAVGGAHLEAINSRGVIAVPHGGEISGGDVDRVIEAAQAVNIQANRQILRVIPQNYTIDEQSGVRNPLGMKGVRLEVEAHIITGLAPALKNLENAVHQSGVDVDDFIPAPLAAAEAVLSKRQKELGVVAIDIGSSSTGISVFEEGVVIASFVLPVGGDSVSNDVAIGLRTSVDAAEKLKIEYGTAKPADVSDRETIDLAAISRADSQIVDRRQLAEIIHARYHEILSLVNEKLQTIERDGQLPAGAVITGGGAKIPELIELARETLSLPVQIGFPVGVDGGGRSHRRSGVRDRGRARPFRRERLATQLFVGNVDFGRALDGVKNFFKKLLP